MNQRLIEVTDQVSSTRQRVKDNRQVLREVCDFVWRHGNSPGDESRIGSTNWVGSASCSGCFCRRLRASYQAISLSFGL
ncbi:hypothetical protein Plhal304r1_c005g0020111 [Plasmopara halstedii]